MAKVTKRFQKIYDEEKYRLAFVISEFKALEKAMLAYEKAVNNRMLSASLNGKDIGGHCASVSNSHQRETDRLRDAGIRFAEKVCGYGYRIATEKSDTVFSKVLDEFEENSLL